MARTFMTNPALRFSRVTKNYNKTRALDDLSFEVQQGECLALAGVNGAGKTTLLKCLLDLCAVESGVIEIFGTSHRAAQARAPLAFLPERFNPPYYLSGKDFLRYMAELDRVRLDEQKLRQTLAALDLEPAAIAKPARYLSKGMTQKLGLVSCLLSEKQLYILDEPLSGLDPKARAQVKDLLKQRRESGVTLFFTSHALNDIEELADRMVILHEGALRFHGLPSGLARAYGASSLEQAFLRCIG
jgi:ABC-type multidrug transport system ATPase subunit